MFGRAHNTRSWLIVSLFFCFSGLLIVRLFSLQCIQHSRYSIRARNQHQSTSYLPSRRGQIYDCQGNMLAASVPSFSLYCIPRLIEDEQIGEIASAISPIIEIDEGRLSDLLSGSRWFVWLKRHLSDDAVASIRQLDLPGLALKQELKRVYPKGSLLSQVIGFTDIDGNGLEGIEWKFDRQLRGHPGWMVTEKDSKQREASWFRSDNVSPIDGCNLFLTIDEVIQAIAEEEIEKVYREYGAKWASVLVIEPSTGRILAMANRPTYDPNQYSSSNAEERRNRLVSDLIEPGSTFKVFPAAGVLDEGLVSPETEFYCEDGAFSIGGRLLRDSHPHGVLRFDEIIQKSSNIGMAKVGMLLGRGDLYRLLRRFGIGERTGIDLPGEADGVLRPPHRWSKLSLRSITMGHEVSLSPLALLTAFSALGNDGVLLQPRIVDRIESPSGEVIYRYGKKERGKVVSKDTAEKMMEILQKVVVEGGTGRRAYISGYEVAGKTGTAQKLDPNGGGYSHSLFRALFMGMLPASNPRLAILVVVDEPHPYYYGGVVAAPVFKDVAERIIRYMDLEAPKITEET